MSRCLRAAYSCALLPLVTGTAIFCAWVSLRWDSLEDAGVATIQIGLVLFCIGFVCLMIDITERADTIAVFCRFHKLSFLAAVLLLSNFPLAVAYVAAAINIETRYYVTVENAREQAVESFTVTGDGGLQVDFGPIAPKAIVRRWFHVASDGEVLFHADLGDEETTGTLDGYSMIAVGDNKQVMIKSDNSIEVTDGT